MSSTALVLVDIQNDCFEDGRWPVHKMQHVSENVASLLDSARANGHAVIHVRHEIPSDDAPFFDPDHMGSSFIHQLHHATANRSS